MAAKSSNKVKNKTLRPKALTVIFEQSYIELYQSLGRALQGAPHLHPPDPISCLLCFCADVGCFMI